MIRGKIRVSGYQVIRVSGHQEFLKKEDVCIKGRM